MPAHSCKSVRISRLFVHIERARDFVQVHVIQVPGRLSLKKAGRHRPDILTTLEYPRQTLVLHTDNVSNARL